MLSATSTGELLVKALMQEAGRRASSALVVPATLEGQYNVRYNAKKDGEEAMVYEFALPGLTKSDVSVDLEGEFLVISSGYELPHKEQYIVSSAAVSPFRMRFRVPTSARVSSAKMENGLLSIRIETKRDVTRVAID